MSPERCERGLIALLHLVRRSAPHELDDLLLAAARLRALCAIPIAQREPRAIPQSIRRLDLECARLFGLRFEDLSTLDLDVPTPTLRITCDGVAGMLADARALEEDPHVQLALGRHLALLGAPHRARPLFRAVGATDPARAGIARGWYLLASLLAGDADDAARLVRQTRDAGDFQYADGDHYLDIYEAWIGALNGVMRSFQRPTETLLDAHPEGLGGPSFVYFELAMAASATGRLEAARRALERVRAEDFEALYTCAVAASPAFVPMWRDPSSRRYVEAWYAEAAQICSLPDAETVRVEVERLLASRA